MFHRSKGELAEKPPFLSSILRKRRFERREKNEKVKSEENQRK